ncbi:MAG: Gfo/Idh/MocA family oxidoreductase [Acidobacteria bacterium]|nr:Gfo/Idh/MocA family oxidoreductase [Acidobacteriota bacterium]MCL5744966.1 Gfo/Idh/MocA family oxidoreductase [Acidobacteriota bacterium]
MSDRTARRTFLQTSGAAGVLLLKPETVFGTQANSALAVGIIGCGGRGNFIGGLFMEYGGARVVALADAFRDRAEAAAKNLKLNSPRQYVGLNAYRELVASNLDVVAVDSPPYFHPEHVEAAVAASKHVFLAKPVAVDVPGCRSIAASGEKATGKVSFFIDWPARARPPFQEAAARIHRGDIGELLLGHVYYHCAASAPRGKPGVSADEARLRDWQYDRVLSGDIIVEQNVHPLDTANWYAQAHPVKAIGTGGGRAGVTMGDCWNRFLVQYWYPGELQVDFSSAQFCKGFYDIGIRMYGTRGTADTHHLGPINITGEKPWAGYAGPPKGYTGLWREGPIINVKEFAASIRTGKFLNNAAPSVDATLTGILGRTAAYQGALVTWDEMMRRNEKLTARLKL